MRRNVDPTPIVASVSTAPTALPAPSFPFPARFLPPGRELPVPSEVWRAPGRAKREAPRDGRAVAGQVPGLAPPQEPPRCPGMGDNGRPGGSLRGRLSRRDGGGGCAVRARAVRGLKKQSPAASPTAGLRAHLVGSPSGATRLMQVAQRGARRARCAGLDGNLALPAVATHMSGPARRPHEPRRGICRVARANATSSRWPVRSPTMACRWLVRAWWVNLPTASST